MRNPIPDMIFTLVVLTAIFIAVHSYQGSLRNINLEYYDYMTNTQTERLG